MVGLTVWRWIAILFGIAACVVIGGVVGLAVYFRRAVNWEAIAAGGTFAAAAFALAAALVNAEQASWSRLALGISALTEFDTLFGGADYRQKRKTASTMLRDHKPMAETDTAFEDVFDCFETIGLMTRRSGLDPEMVWSTFFYWLHGYWLVGEDFVHRQQTKSPARYGDVAWLHTTLIRTERRKKSTLNNAEWADFLDEEADLATPGAPCPQTNGVNRKSFCTAPVNGPGMITQINCEVRSCH